MRLARACSCFGTGPSGRLEAEAHPRAHMVLEAFAPAFATFGAVDRFPVSEHHSVFADGVFELDFTAPVGASWQLGVTAGAVEARAA